MLVPMLVIAEVSRLVRSLLGIEAEIRFIGDFAAGNFIPKPVASGDWLRVAELTAQYEHLSLGTTKASIVAAIERLDATHLATLDRRFLSVLEVMGSVHLRPARTDLSRSVGTLNR